MSVGTRAPSSGPSRTVCAKVCLRHPYHYGSRHGIKAPGAVWWGRPSCGQTAAQLDGLRPAIRRAFDGRAGEWPPWSPRGRLPLTTTGTANGTNLSLAVRCRVSRYPGRPLCSPQSDRPGSLLYLTDRGRATHSPGLLEHPDLQRLGGTPHIHEQSRVSLVDPSLTVSVKRPRPPSGGRGFGSDPRCTCRTFRTATRDRRPGPGGRSRPDRRTCRCNRTK